MNNEKLVIAVPKGRILDEAMPIINGAGIIPEDDFFNKKSRLLSFKTNHPHIELIRVRSFDVATFVAFGAAQLGICGSDVLMEFDYSDIYAPLDLNIGYCRISVAAPKEEAIKDDPTKWSHIRVATKYPNITKKYFEKRGVQAECIKLNGAMELAPSIGLCKRIVDLVSSGATMKANGLQEIEHITEITSKLVVNRQALKTRNKELNSWINSFRSSLKNL